MTETYADDTVLKLKLPAVAGKNAQPKPKPSSILDFFEDFEPPIIVDKNDLRLPSTNSETLDSPDEIATKAAAKDFLDNLPSQNSAKKMPNLPIQYDDPVANQLFQLYFQAMIDSDKKQGIKSQLYQAPSNGKVIFCRDTCGYDKNQPIDPCYAYARYGIGLYISQRIIYNTYGVENTDFIVKQARNFYTQFIANMEDYQTQLPKSLTKEEKAEKANRYAREYLSDIVDGIALELTEQLGPQHKEFKTVEASLASLDSIVISASMACEPIPYVTREKFSHNTVNKEYVSIVHPKAGKRTDEIAELYENFNLTMGTAEEKEPLSLSNTEGETEEKPMPEGKGAHNFFDDLKICKKRVAHYFKPAILAGKVSLCSQDRGNFAGVKNVRVITTEEVIRDEQGQVQQLKEIGTIAGNSTALAAFKNLSEPALVDYNRRTLLQLHHIMTKDASNENSTTQKRDLRLCVISLCGIDIKTTFDNLFREKDAQIDPLDAKIARLTDIAASQTGGKVFSNNFAVNFERLAAFITGDDAASRLAQNAIAALTGYKNLSEMLSYIYHAVGIIENIAYMQEFIDAFGSQFTPEERYRFEQYLKLMEKVLAVGDSRNPIGNLNTFLDITAVFAMLCDVHNELAVKYDRDKKIDIIKPIINCASGKNRTGSAIFHYRVLSRTADIIGVDCIHELLEEKYHPLRCAIGDEIARIDISHEDTLGASGTRKKSAGSICAYDVTPAIRDEYMLTEHSTYFKGLVPKASSKSGEYVYIHKKDRVGVSRNLTLKEIVLNKIEAFIPKQIGSIQDSLGLNLLEPVSPTATMAAESDWVKHASAEKKEPPHQQNNKPNIIADLKKGNIISAFTGAFILVVTLMFAEHLPHILPIICTLTGAGIFAFGRSCTREAEAEKKEKLEGNPAAKSSACLYRFLPSQRERAPVNITQPSTDKQWLAPPAA